MDIKKIMSISIKTPEKLGEDFLVTVNGMEFRAKTQTGAITLALDYLGEPATLENILEFIQVDIPDLIQVGTRNEAPVLTNAQTGAGIVTPAEAHRSDNLPVKQKSKGKVGNKPKPENELVGKVFLGKKGELFRLVAVTPPGDWQFELECLDTDNRGGTKRLGLKEFKELVELVPKRSRRKEGR